MEDEKSRQDKRRRDQERSLELDRLKQIEIAHEKARQNERSRDQERLLESDRQKQMEIEICQEKITTTSSSRSISHRRKRKKLEAIELEKTKVIKHQLELATIELEKENSQSLLHKVYKERGLMKEQQDSEAAIHLKTLTSVEVSDFMNSDITRSYKHDQLVDQGLYSETEMNYSEEKLSVKHDEKRR